MNAFQETSSVFKQRKVVNILSQTCNRSKPEMLKFFSPILRVTYIQTRTQRETRCEDRLSPLIVTHFLLLLQVLSPKNSQKRGPLNYY